jgi:hypothetical protein
MNRFRSLLLASIAVLAISGQAIGEEMFSKTPTPERQSALNSQRSAMLGCLDTSVEMFDDRISPANVVASAVAWYCEAEGNPHNYWIILSSRRSSPDTVDVFYRDLALPFVLQHRSRRLRLPQGS